MQKQRGHKETENRSRESMMISRRRHGARTQPTLYLAVLSAQRFGFFLFVVRFIIFIMRIDYQGLLLPLEGKR